MTNEDKAEKINLLNVFLSLMTSTPALPNLPEVSIRFATDLYRWFDWKVLEYLFDRYRSELWL